MIFTGDIALPYEAAINQCDFPSNLMSKKWFGNLEGALVTDGDSRSRTVYNDFKAVNQLVSTLNFAGFALANNHIFDTGSLSETIKFLEQIDIPYCGAGNNLKDASRELVITERDQQIVIVNFGWEVIQCQITQGTDVGVNPLERNHVISTVTALVEKYPNGHVVPFMHWGYELEGEPQPFERELAYKLIDIGAAGIIGAHSHRVGGFETYRGKPIVYSLGNWMFAQNIYHNGKIRFPEFCNLQLAFEWNFDTNEFFFHFFKFNPANSTIDYIRTENKSSETMKELTPFRGLSNAEYKHWYRANHYHKNKGLPVYYWEDNHLQIQFKNRYNKFRDAVVSLIGKLR